MKVSLVTCGRCGKPRGLLHTCVTRRPRRGPTRIQLRATCSACGKPMGNPLRHVCTTKTDFRKRTRAAERAAVAAKRRARRKAATAAKRERAKARRKTRRTAAPKPKHDYATCPDLDCARVACQAWREGVEFGVLACPREHV